MNDSPVKILIPEWVPSLNKGELAILIGMLKTFETIGNVRVSIFSLFPSIDGERYPKNINLIDLRSELYLKSSSLEILDGSGLVKTKVYLLVAVQHLLFILLYKILGKRALGVMKRGIWRGYCKSDVIIISHDQLSCVFGFILFLSPIYINLLAKALHKPVIIYANGCSGFKENVSKILATFVLNNVDLITARDEESFLNLRRYLWDKRRIYLTADPAVLLPSVDFEKVKDLMRKENVDKKQGLLIGVSITHEVLLSAFQENLKTKIRYNRAITEVARVFDRLIEEFQASIIFIPHCIEPYTNRDDRVTSKEIYGAMKNKHKARVILKEYSPEELKGLIGEFDLLISARVHFAISALSMGVPSYILTRSWDRRAYGLIGKTLKQEKWIYNVENLNADTLFAGITDLLSDSDKIRKDLPSIINSMKEKALLNGRLLKALLDSRKASCYREK